MSFSNRRQQPASHWSISYKTDNTLNSCLIVITDLLHLKTAKTKINDAKVYHDTYAT